MGLTETQQLEPFLPLPKEAFDTDLDYRPTSWLCDLHWLLSTSEPQFLHL